MRRRVRRHDRLHGATHRLLSRTVQCGGRNAHSSLPLATLHVPCNTGTGPPGQLASRRRDADSNAAFCVAISSGAIAITSLLRSLSVLYESPRASLSAGVSGVENTNLLHDYIRTNEMIFRALWRPRQRMIGIARCPTSTPAEPVARSCVR